MKADDVGAAVTACGIGNRGSVADLVQRPIFNPDIYRRVFLDPGRLVIRLSCGVLCYTKKSVISIWPVGLKVSGGNVQSYSTAGNQETLRWTSDYIAHSRL